MTQPIFEVIAMCAIICYASICGIFIRDVCAINGTVDIHSLKTAGGRNFATYILPGLLSPKMEEFQTCARKLPGNVYYVNYGCPTIFSEKYIAAQVLSHIQNHRYTKVEFVSFAMGTKIAYELSDSDDYDSRSYFLNPATRSYMLKWYVRLPLVILLPVCALIAFFVPFISTIKFIKINGIKHSLLELLSGGFSLAYDELDCNFTCSKGANIVISKYDKLLNNEKILDAISIKMLRKKRVEIIDTKHARIYDKYQAALKKLGAFDSF